MSESFSYPRLLKTMSDEQKEIFEKFDDCWNEHAICIPKHELNNTREWTSIESTPIALRKDRML